MRRDYRKRLKYAILLGFMHTNIDTVKKGIEESLLLSPERKKSLRALLADLTPEGLTALGNLLLQEPTRIAAAMERVVGHAIADGNTEWLKNLEGYLRDAARSLRRASEGATDNDEANELDHFFDAAA